MFIKNVKERLLINAIATSSGKIYDVPLQRIISFIEVELLEK